MTMQLTLCGSQLGYFNRRVGVLCDTADPPAGDFGPAVNQQRHIPTQCNNVYQGLYLSGIIHYY